MVYEGLIMHNPVDKMLSDFFRYHMDLYQAHYSFIVQRNASVDHGFFFSPGIITAKYHRPFTYNLMVSY